MTETITPKQVFKNKYIALASHPFIDTKDGSRDLIVRAKTSPKYAMVPLLDHHEFEKEPIGYAELSFIPCAELSDTHDLHVVTALIATDLDLDSNQNVSIGASLDKTIGKYNIYSDIVELSLVDIGHLNGAQLVEENKWNDMIHSLYSTAPVIIKKILTNVYGKI
jgi:hypothetical protein